MPVDSRALGHQPLATATRLVSIHLLLLGCFGQYYAKMKVGALFPTEVVLLLVSAASLRNVRRLSWDPLTKCVVMFVAIGCVWAFASGLGSMDGVGPKAFSFFVYSAFFLAIRLEEPSDAQLWKMLRTFATTSVVAAVIGLAQAQSGVPLLGGEGFEMTTTGSTRWLPGEFTLYALFASLIVAVPAILKRHIPARDYVLLGAATIELVLTQQRSGFLSIAIALLTTALFLAGSAQALRGLVRLVAILAVGIAIALYLGGASFLGETVSRIAHVNDLADANIDWRLLAWYEVGIGVLEQPLGHGFAHWDFLFTWEDPLTGSHNSFLDLTYRVGVVGLVVMLAMPFMLIRETRERVRADGSAHHLLLVTTCAMMIAFLIFSLFNVVFETPQMSVLFWVLLAVGAVALARARSNVASSGTAPTS